MPILVSMGLGHCRWQLSHTISLRVTTSSMEAKLGMLEVDLETTAFFEFLLRGGCTVRYSILFSSDSLALPTRATEVEPLILQRVCQPAATFSGDVMPWDKFRRDPWLERSDRNEPPDSLDSEWLYMDMGGVLPEIATVLSDVNGLDDPSEYLALRFASLSIISASFLCESGWFAA